MENATGKCRHVEYTKRTLEPRILYCVHDADGVAKTVSPSKWHHIDLPDTSSSRAIELSAELQAKSKRHNQFRLRVEDNQEYRAACAAGETRSFYVFVCDTNSIRY